MTAPTESVVVGDWPPAAGQPYPDLILKDQDGQTVRLSSFKGKTILVELTAVSCPGCQGLAGGNDLGGFAGVSVQSGLESIHKYAQRYGKVTINENDNVVFVQLLLFGKTNGTPTQAEVSGWAKHFKMEKHNQEYVLGGHSSMTGQASFDMIPGFHLIDKDFVLQSDSAGHHPKHDLYTHLLPMLGRLSQ